MTSIRHIALATLTVPLALALAACGEDATEAGGLNGEPIAAIAAPAGQQWITTAVATPEGGVLVGNPDAPLKLIEYASHTCPACANFNDQAHDRLNEYIATGVVSLELRNQVHNALDLTIAMMVRCGDPVTMQPLSSQVWRNLQEVINNAQANSANISDNPDTRWQEIAQSAGLIEFFAARGISADQSMQCLANTDLATQIAERSETQSEELDVTGTPTFFLNGRKLDGSSWSALEPILQAAGAQ